MSRQRLYVYMMLGAGAILLALYGLAPGLLDPWRGTMASPLGI